MPSMGGRPPREDSASHSFRSCMGGSPIPWRVLLNSMNPLNLLNLLNLLDLRNLLNALHAFIEFTESAPSAAAAATYCVSSLTFKLIPGPFPHWPSLRFSQPRGLLSNNPSSLIPTFVPPKNESKCSSEKRRLMSWWKQLHQANPWRHSGSLRVASGAHPFRSYIGSTNLLIVNCLVLLKAMHGWVS